MEIVSQAGNFCAMATYQRLTTDDLPSLEERPALQMYALRELAQEHR